MSIEDVVEKIAKGKKVNFKAWSYVALGICIFFLLGSFFGVDESTKDTLPTIYGISAVSAVVFVAFRAMILVQKRRLN